MFIGMDDTDSPGGMCTTYLGAMLAQILRHAGYAVGELRLVRLNPNVVWRTRGNAAVCIEVAGGKPEEVFQIACELIEKYAMFDCEKTNPGVVIVDERPDPVLYYQALQRLCTIEEAIEQLDNIRALYRGYKCGRGLIGALAAVSSVLPDATYELLTYRSADRLGTPRMFEPESFFASAAATAPHTWDTVDSAAHAVVCVPHGKDPVLYGIRGESPEWVAQSVTLLRSEKSAFSQIWRTNQGTDAPLIAYTGELVGGLSYQIDGSVASVPETRRGGHVRFVLRTDASGQDIPVFAFEPTKDLRHAVRKLLPGDRITACGSYQKGVLHLEKFRLNAVAVAERRVSPKCPICGGRMTSAGRGKGYKCRSCSARIRETEWLERAITEGWYEASPGARRHLAKPIIRMRDAAAEKDNTSDNKEI